MACEDDGCLPAQLKERAPNRLALQLGRLCDRLREECASEARQKAAPDK
jgi:hypothetical protein